MPSAVIAQLWVAGSFEDEMYSAQLSSQGTRAPGICG